MPLTLLLTVLAVLLAGCRDAPHPAGLTDEQFIDTIVELRRSATEAGSDEAAYAAARDRVLADRGVTQEQLGEYVRQHSADLEHLAEVWGTVNSRLASARIE